MTGFGAEELIAKEEAVLLVMICVDFPASTGSELFQPPKSSSFVIAGDGAFAALEPPLLSTPLPQPNSLDITGGGCGCFNWV